MNDTDLIAHLEFMSWRDEQLEAISDQLQLNFPVLLQRIDERVDEAGTLDLAWSEVQIGKEISGLCGKWADEQSDIALKRTEVALNEFQERMALEFSIDPAVSERLVAMAPALASLGLAAASLAAVPTVISFATVTTSVFAFVGVSYISWPLFTVGAVALGVAAYASRSLYDWAIDNWRERLRERAHRRAVEVVFGLGNAAGQRTVLDDIQALAIKAAANSMEAAN